MPEADVTDAAADVLSLEAVEGLRDQLAVLDPEASDAGRVDLIRSLEELKCAAEAAQARLSVELDASMRTDAHLAGVVAERQARGVAAQVGLARRVSGNRGERLLSLAKVVSREMPHLMAAWTAGKVSERRVIDLARETACLDFRHRHTIDRDLRCRPAVPDGLPTGRGRGGADGGRARPRRSWPTPSETASCNAPPERALRPTPPSGTSPQAPSSVPRPQSRTRRSSLSPFETLRQAQGRQPLARLLVDRPLSRR